MPPGKSLRLRAAARTAAALVALCALPPAAALAAESRTGDGALSPRLAELATPSLRSAPADRQAEELGVAAGGPGSLLRDGNRVLVEVRFDRGVAAADDLRDAGAAVVDHSSRYRTVTAAVKPAELGRLSGVTGVASVTEVLTPVVSASSCPSGAAVSEGDGQLRAAEARTAFGLDGGGVTVGILSDSFDRADEAADGTGPIATHEIEDVESADLPGLANPCGQVTPVDVLDDQDGGGEDEGRAMAQIVHDLAPGADLSFATAFTGLTAFAKNIKDLALAGATVIADDVTYFEEPFFQEGPVGVAVSEVSEDGVSYFSSAANNNLVAGGRDIASWEAPQFRDSGACPAAVVAQSQAFEAAAKPGLNPDHCVDFNPGAGVDRAFRITASPGVTLNVDLQWAEAWGGVDTDLDAFLLGPEGAVVAESIEDNVFGSEQPFEFVSWQNQTGAAANVQLVVNRYSGSSPRLKFVLLQNGGGVTSTEYEASLGGDVVGPTIFGHNGGASATSVGAIRYTATEAPEKYSSRGPVTHYFGPVKGPTAAAPLKPPEVLSKPDLTATDCGATTFFASFSSFAWRFCGTSAAAPHAAAVAALMLQQDPGATPEAIRSALAEAASPIGTFGPCAVGAGLVDAVGAIERLLSPEPEAAPACVSPVSEPGEPSEDVDTVPTPGEANGQPEGAAPPAAEPAPEEPVGSAVRQLPRTVLLRRPPRVIRTHRARATVVFRFGADEDGATFACRVDGESFHGCGPRFVGRFGAGAHVLRVVARTAAGDDPTPAVYRFRVKRLG